MIKFIGYNALEINSSTICDILVRLPKTDGSWPMTHGCMDCRGGFCMGFFCFLGVGDMSSHDVLRKRAVPAVVRFEDSFVFASEFRRSVRSSGSPFSN